MPLDSAVRDTVRPLEPRSLSAQVTDELRRSILSGALAPGESLSLRKLADALRVSFIPVRDALKVLEAEALVVNPPGRSATVAPLDLDELHGIYRVRRTLEPDLARRSCGSLTDEELDRLDEAAIRLGSPDLGMDDTYDDHRAFHTALLAPALSAWDSRILTMLWGAGERYVRIGFGLLDPDPREHERRAEAHRLLVREFGTREPERAASALEEHLARNEEIARAALALHADR